MYSFLLLPIPYQWDWFLALNINMDPWCNSDQQYSVFIPNFENKLQQEETLVINVLFLFGTTTIIILCLIEELGSSNWETFWDILNTFARVRLTQWYGFAQ